MIDEFAKYLIKHHRIQANELKSVNICSKKRYIIPEVIDFLIKNDCNIFVEVVNKKYQLCSAINEYYLLCPYLMGEDISQESMELRRLLCDFIYEFIDNKFIEDFVMAFSTADDDLTYVEKCIDDMRNLVKYHPYPDELTEYVDDVNDILQLFRRTGGNIMAKKDFCLFRIFLKLRNMEYFQM